MRVIKLLAITTVALLVFEQSLHAQRSKVTHSGYRYASPKVRGHKARIICPVFETSRYPYHGIGFKLGDPFAFTYKFYPNKRFSLAIDAGRPATGLYSDYFRLKFEEYVAQDHDLSGTAKPVYVAHRTRKDFVGALKMLYHVDAEQIAEGLQAYAGVGWSWRYTHVAYDYEINQDVPESDPFGAFERHRRTMGPQLSAGIEYAYFRIPVSAFMEIEYFSDLQADPGYQRFLGGVGLRYVF